MLTQEAHRGGSIYLASIDVITTLYPGTRVVHIARSSGVAAQGVKMPTLGRYEDVNRDGRPMFIVLSTGTTTQEIRNPAGTNMGSIGQGEYREAYYLGGGAWTVSEAKKIHTHAGFAGFVNYENRAVGVVDEEIRPSYNPFCFTGTDCEYLESVGNQHALDGTEGYATAVAPMYQDVVEHAVNSHREAVRAADVIMPNLIAIRFREGAFSVDTDHPWYGTHSLSDEFYDALYRTLPGFGIISPHVLAYDAALSGAATSRDPHHLSYSGTNWEHGTGAANLTVRTHVWKSEVRYGPESDPTAYTLQILYVMEHTMSAEVPVDCATGTGPDGSADKGMHGALFRGAVFTDELNPLWNDGVSTFTPVGFTSAHVITRGDPVISGLAFGISDGATTLAKASRKGVHPQCVVAFNLPTTFEAPVGHNNIPISNLAKNRNLERLYDVPNGCPWLTGACADTFPGDDGTWPTGRYGILHNCVFGQTVGGNFGRAMSLGGDMKRSVPTPFVLIENGGSTGRTFLQPERPGWIESCGKLSVAGGSDIEIFMCVDEDAWPVCAGMSCCDGHPDEPFEGVGGSHTCFRTYNQAQGRDGRANTTCCIPTADASVAAYAYCQRDKVKYGGPSGAGCTTVETKCDYLGAYFTQAVLPLADYDMKANGAVKTREMIWAQVRRDKDYRRRNWIYSSADADLANVLGTFTKGESTLTVATVSGVKPIRAQASFDESSPTAWDWFGCTIECGLNGVNTHKIGLGFLDSGQVGWGMVVSPSGADLTLEILEYTALGATRTVLATVTIAGEGANPTGAAKYTQRGTDIVVQYTPTSGVLVTLTAEVSDGTGFNPNWPSISPHTESSSPYEPSFYTESTTAGAVWDSFSFSSPLISDLVDKQVSFYGQVTWQSIAGSIDEQAAAHHGQCDVISNPNCGTSKCNCTYHATSLRPGTAVYTDSYVGAGLDMDTLISFADCGSVPSHCGENSADDCNISTAGNCLTFAGNFDPLYCRCQGDDCSSQQCQEACPVVNQKVLSFHLPVSYVCWDSPIDPFCWGQIPLICYGFTTYNAWACL